MTAPSLTIEFKTYVRCDDGEVYLVDTIRHDDGLWLVPKWLVTPFPNRQRPARIIRMDSLAHKDLGPNFLRSGHHALQLDDLMPKAVLDGASQSRPSAQFDVREEPELYVRRDP